MTPTVGVRRFDPGLRDAFFRIHSDANGHGWCRCVAWWVPTWDGWAERTGEQNLAVRESLLEHGEYDGYLLDVDGEPVAWCQAGPRDRLRKHVDQLALPPEPRTCGLTCFFVAPAHRGRGLATMLLRGVLDDLRYRGVRRAEAYPKRAAQDVEELWNGSREMFEGAGFDVVSEHDPARLIMARDL